MNLVLRLVPFLLLFSSLSEAKEFIFDLAITAIFQNEAPYLKEWIDYHRKVGVEYFILFNNNSEDDYASVLEPYIKEGVVKLIQWPSFHPDGKASFINFCYKIQTSAFNTAISLSKWTTKWLAMIDVDEYIVPVLDETIVECLEKRYPAVAGLYVNWQCYGTSHVEKLDPSKPMINQLLWKAPKDNALNLFFKSIVRPWYVLECIHPHACAFIPGFFSVDTVYRKCVGGSQSQSVEIDTIRINHYWVKDEWFLHQVKVPRYVKWGTPVNEILEKAETMNQEYDPILEHFSL